MNKILIWVGISLAPCAQAYADSSAVVIALKGEVQILGGKAKSLLHMRDTVPAGSTVSTGALSFVRLVFPDNSVVNIGPSTEIKIQPAANVPTMEVLTGEIRAKVIREVIQKAAAKDGDDLKMVIQTRSSAIGVRGTDFLVMYNPTRDVTALLTFEGHVSMAKLDSRTAPVAAILSRAAVSVGPGQFSTTTPGAPTATPPIKISPTQLQMLKLNPTMQPGAQAPAPKGQTAISPIPPGADPKALASSGAGLASVLGTPPTAPGVPAAQPENGPRAGGFVDLSAAIYVPPPPGSAYDPITGVFVPPAAAGTLNSATGTYQPPSGVVLNAQTGKFEAAPPSGTSPAPASAAAAAALNQAVASPSASGSISLDTSPAAGPGAGGAALTPPGAPNAAPPPPPPPPPDAFAPRENNNCLTCHDNNVQVNHKASRTPVGLQVIVQ